MLSGSEPVILSAVDEFESGCREGSERGDDRSSIYEHEFRGSEVDPEGV